MTSASGQAKENVTSGALASGEMAELVHAFDWANTPLGSVDCWSPSLRTLVTTLLANRFPLLLWWGPDHIQLYNDAYRPVLGTKHPRSLGQQARECWPEIWHVIGPLIETPYTGGPPTWDNDLFLEVNRHGFLEETHFTVAYSPVPDDTVPSGVGGVLATVHETTQQVIQERRLAILRDLGARSADAKTAEEACGIAAQVLEQHPMDVPFALLYLVDADQRIARLATAAGIPAHLSPIPTTADLRAGRDDGTPWFLAEVMRTERARVAPNPLSVLEVVPLGPWSDPSQQALVLPIPSSAAHVPAGMLVLRLSPRLALDDAYRGFGELVAGQIGTAIVNARAYDEERRRAEALADLDRAKTTFFSNVSHEFRTPLTLLLGPLEEMLDGSEETLGESQRELLDVAHRNALRLLRLVNTLLDFSRIEAGRIQASYEPTDLPALTANLASSFRSAVERSGLQLVVTCPPLPVGVEVYVDRDMWEKIVLNLLSNAFKFTFQGEIGVQIRLGSDRKTVDLIVRDTGAGIPAEELPRLFERFHRVQGTRARTQEGTGIGLSLVQELTKLHGGMVNLESVVDTGTTFTVTIPTGKAHLPTDRIGAGSTLASTATGAAPFIEEASRWLPGEDKPADDWPHTPREASDESRVGSRDAASISAHGRVLLVDDNADMRDYVARLLRQRYRVEALADGQAALGAAQAHLPDLVLADIMMPGLDGFGLLRALRADPRTRNIPVILLSARAGEEARVEGIDAGADDYLVKPFAARELLARVGTHIVLARNRAETADRERALRAEADRAHAVAARERSRLRELFMQAPAAIGMLRGPEHVYELANGPYLNIIGQRDILGKPIREALPDLEGRGIYELFDHAYTTGEPFFMNETPAATDRGRGRLEERYFNVAFQPFRDENDEVAGIVVLAVEVTDQVRARRQVEEAVRVRDEFLSIASHELRTPVTVVRGMAQMLQRAARSDSLDADRLPQQVDAIQRAADRLTLLINDLVDVSRLQSGRLNLRLEQLDLRSSVREFVDQQIEILQSARDVRVMLPEQPVMVTVDTIRLEQILDNLLSNAVKYSPDGGQIDVTVTADSEGVTIATRDRGIGLPEGMVERIFEPFGRAENAVRRDLPGTGLGLFVSRRLAELHGGRLWAESEGDGQGTTLHLWLPAVAPGQTLNRPDAKVDMAQQEDAKG